MKLYSFNGFIETSINEGLIPPTDIFEITDGIEGWAEDDDSLLSVEYTFYTSTQKYKVKFSSFDYKAEDRTFEMSFGLDRGELHQIDVYTMTNAGNVRTIIKTIAFIIDEFLYQYDESAEKVVIEATDTKRKRLYQILFPLYLSKDSLSKVAIK